MSKDIIKYCYVKCCENTELKPALLDAGDQMVLVNLLKPWTLMCPSEKHPIPIQYSTYHIINHTEFCNCPLAAGPYFIGQIVMDYFKPSAKGGIFTTYYTF